MSDDAPAVLIAAADGTLLERNLAAEEILGAAPAESCRALLERQPGARKLPCKEGCTQHLVHKGTERAQAHRIQLGGRPATLTCVPVDDKVLVRVQPHSVTARGPWEQLTARELEVLQAVAEGRETAAIAVALGVGQATIRTHVQHMRQKLGVSTRAGLVARAFRLGWLR
jgi:DNA-binding CsgD family transcriptional regulator